MRKRRYEILLPLKFNDGSFIPDDALARTKDEILERFQQLEIYVVSHPIDRL